MLASQIPAKVPEPFGKNAGANFIRTIPTVTADPTAASYDQGFPQATGTPIGSGGTPPSIKDVNGILNIISAWANWLAAGGGIPKYDSAYSTVIGGYPAGAILQSATLTGILWISTADNNTTDPDGVSPANWQLFGGAGATTGDTKWRPSNDNLLNAVSGFWVRCNGTTVGNASSNASQLQSPIAQGLFTYLWTNFPNSVCQLFNSSGSPISRSGSAAADFAANCAIATLDMRGATPKGLPDMGTTNNNSLTGVPINTSGGTLTTPGASIGENRHQLTVPELASHTHQYSATNNNNALVGGGAGANANSLSNTVASGSTGGDQPHNTVDLTVLGAYYMKV